MPKEQDNLTGGDKCLRYTHTHTHPESASEAAKRKVHSTLKERMTWGEKKKNEEPQNEEEDHCQRWVSHCREKKANDTIENT